MVSVSAIFQSCDQFGKSFEFGYPKTSGWAWNRHWVVFLSSLRLGAACSAEPSLHLFPVDWTRPRSLRACTPQRRLVHWTLNFLLSSGIRWQIFVVAQKLLVRVLHRWLGLLFATWSSRLWQALYHRQLSFLDDPFCRQERALRMRILALFGCVFFVLAPLFLNRAVQVFLRWSGDSAGIHLCHACSGRTKSDSGLDI